MQMVRQSFASTTTTCARHIEKEILLKFKELSALLNNKKITFQVCVVGQWTQMYNFLGGRQKAFHLL